MPRIQFKDTSNICKFVKLESVGGREPVILLLLNEIVFNLVSRFKLDGNDPLNWLLLIINVTRFVSRPIEDGMDE